MDLKKAEEHLNPAPTPQALGRVELRDRLRSTHGEHTQRHAHASQALERLFDALDDLAKLGHKFDVTEATPVDAAEYPRMMYHDNFAPVTVSDAEAEAMLGPDWHHHPTERPVKEEAGAGQQEG